MNWFQRLFGGVKEIKPEEMVQDAASEARAVLQGDLLSAYCYGSLAAGEYAPGYSNVNLLLVTRRLDLETLKRLAPLVASWEKWPQLKPLVLSQGELPAYAENFPMEFGDLLECRRILGGEELLPKINFSQARLAQELEGELRISLTKLRKKCLVSGGEEEALRSQIADSAKSLFPVLRAFLRLKKRKAPRQRVRLIEEACRSFRFGRRTLLQVHDLRYGRKNAERIETMPLFEKLLQELALMADEASRFVGAPSPASSEERPGRRDGRDFREGRGREGREGREGTPGRNGGGDRNAKLGQVRQLIQEASQRKKWEPKDPERFQSDEFSRDGSLSLSARFGWDRAWQPERRAKGYVPLEAPKTVLEEEPSYEEEFGESSESPEAAPLEPEFVAATEAPLSESPEALSPRED